MFATERMLTQALLSFYFNPQLTVQEKGSHNSLHFVQVGDKVNFVPKHMKEEALLVNTTFLEILSGSSNATSFCASDCTLATTDHAAFAKKLPNLEVVELKRGIITNAALNALAANAPNLKVFSLRGEDHRSGPSTEIYFEHELHERPVSLSALQGRQIGMFNLKGYSSLSGILEYIKGVEIDRLVVTPKLMNFETLNDALASSRVHEIEFDSSFSSVVQAPENLDSLTNLRQVPSIRLIGQSVTPTQLASIVKGFGGQMTALDLSGSYELQSENIEMLANCCPKLNSLSLFECKSLYNPNTSGLLNSLIVVARTTPVKHIILGWDNDHGAPTYGEGPDPRRLISANSFATTLSQEAGRQIKVTITNRYPNSKTMDDYS